MTSGDRAHSARRGIWGTVEVQGFSLALAAGLLGSAVGGQLLAALVGLMAALLMPFVQLSARVRRDGYVDSRNKLVLGVFIGLAAVGFIRAMFSDAPLVSLLGARGQHTGAFLWVGLAILAWVGISRGMRGDLDRLASVLTAAGAIFAVAALLERFTGMAFQGVAGDPVSGLMDNAISLAQVLVLCLGCAVYTFFTRTDGLARVLSVLAISVIGAGVWVASTRIVYVAAVVVSILLITCTMLWRRGRLPRRALAIAAVVTALAGLTGPVLLGGFGMANEAVASFDGPLNGRVVVWESAVDRAAMHPLFGFGPDQFNGLASWSASDGGLKYVTTDDPHNSMLYWLLALGAPGVLLVIILVALVASRMDDALAASRWHVGLASLIGALGLQAIIVLTAWTSPLAAVISVMLVASIMAQLQVPASSRLNASSLKNLVGLAVLTVVIAAFGVVTAGSIRTQWEWARLEGGRRATAEALSRMAITSGDALYAVEASQKYQTEASAANKNARIGEAYAQLAGFLRTHSSYSARAAIELALLHQSSMVLGVGGSWPELVDDINRARESHPGTGLWDYLGAAFAEISGTPEEARDFASRALRFPLTDKTREWCEQRAKAD